MSYGHQSYRSDRTRDRYSDDRRETSRGRDNGAYGGGTGGGYAPSTGWGSHGDTSLGTRNVNREEDTHGNRSSAPSQYGQTGNRYGNDNGWNTYKAATREDSYGANNSAPRRDSGYGTHSRGSARDSGYGGNSRGSPRDPGYGSRGRGGDCSYEFSDLKLHHEDYSYLEEINRTFYYPLPVVNGRSAEEVAAIRRSLDISVDPSDCIAPVTSFEEAFESNQRKLDVSSTMSCVYVCAGYILDPVKAAGFERPTPIQCQSWPIILSGYNMIGIAETGSGKTLAFLLPAIAHMLGQPDLAPGDGPMALILAPTRELAIQIHEECEKFGKPCGIKTTCVYGGAKRGPQVRELHQGVHLLVATPGRLTDVVETRDTNLRRVTYFVLDEADRMLDMGFEPQIMRIVDQIRPDRQTVLWSATWPKDVEEIASEIVQRPYMVTIGAQTLKANHNITQRFEILGGYERKIDKLVEFLRKQEGHERILIFCSTKRSVDDVTTHLRKTGFGALAIHGDKEQPEREWVLEEFRRGCSPLMVATDVAQRGLDIKDVYCVVNYDMPNTGEDYVHRIGRTGRAGRPGLSVSFFTPDDARMAKSIIRVLEEAGQQVSQELHKFADNDLREPTFRGRGSGGRGGGSGGFRRTGGNAVPLHHGWGR